MQKTTFPFEIILGDDGSVDGTGDICQQYAKLHPDKIRLFIRDRNLSQFSYNGFVIRFNGIWNRMASRGKYIAWCDGDDFWTDPLKLQKQVDFLEKNPDYGLVHTNSDFYINNHKITYKSIRDINEVSNGYVYDKLLKSNFILTLTVCYRKDLLDSPANFDLIINNNFVADYPMWLEISRKAKFHYLPESTSVYRVLEHSISHSAILEKKLQYERSSYQTKIFYLEKYPTQNLNEDTLRQLHYRKMLSISFNCKNIETAKTYISKIRINSLKDFLKYIIVKVPFIFNFYSKFRKLPEY